MANPCLHEGNGSKYIGPVKSRTDHQKFWVRRLNYTAPLLLSFSLYMGGAGLNSDTICPFFSPQKPQDAAPSPKEKVST